MKHNFIATAFGAILLSACQDPNVIDDVKLRDNAQPTINHQVVIEECTIFRVDGVVLSEEDLTKKIVSLSAQAGQHAVFFKFDSAPCHKMERFIRRSYFPLSDTLNMGIIMPLPNRE